MPSFFKAQFVDVKAEGGLKVGHEEHGPQVPLLSDRFADR